MEHTDRVKILIVAIIAILSGCQSNTVEKPNIIFILTDDQRWDALGYAGNDIIHTPHMDKLAASGLYFENAFVTTPICAASRASIFTGLYERTHDYTFGKPNLNDKYIQESYPYLLREAGYKTGFVGKFGVNVNEGVLDSMFNKHVMTWYPYLKEIEGVQKHLADINGDHAIEFIRSNKGQPFCLSLSFWSPHAEDESEEQYFWPEYADGLYDDVEIPTPETADSAFFHSLPEFLKTSMNRVRWYWRFDSGEKRQRMVKGYYKMISTVDSVIGRMVNTLEDEGLADNTIIILMGDNGYFLGERSYAGKWLMHEQSIRVPLIIYDPRQKEKRRGKSFDEMVLNIDVTPTILDFAGVNVPEVYQGNSLATFAERVPSNWRSQIFLEHRLEGRPKLLLKTEAIRDDNWKFIRYDDHPEFIELYNIHEDINETNNLAYNPEYGELVKSFQLKCDSIAAELISARKGN